VLPRFSGRSLLENAVSRADTGLFGGRELEPLLFECFHLPCSAQGELPFGALRRLGDGLRGDGRFWFQADPVALYPDQDRLLIFDMVDLDLAEAEAQQLIGVFNDHFADEGMRLEMGRACRWYLTLESAPKLVTKPLGLAFGRNMDMFLPEGEDGLQWHRLLNEVQMLFHALEINTERQMNGKMPVSGLWISGGGTLPSVHSAGFDLVIADEPLALGLARTGSVETCSLDAGEALVGCAGEEVLLVDDRLHRAVWNADPGRWLEQIESFANRFEAYVANLRSGRFAQIRLYPADGRVYSITPGSIRRFWRRRQALSRLITEN